jgi:hypothetical protein
MGWLIPLLFIFCLGVSGVPKKDGSLKEQFLAQYKKKFVVVLREGLSMGFSADPTNPYGYDSAFVSIQGDDIKTCRSKIPLSFEQCGGVTLQAVHRGEVFYVDHVHLKKDCWLFLVAASPRSLQRGVGPYAHDSLEAGKLIIEFKPEHPDDLPAISALVGSWFKAFDNAEGAVKFGNTAAGATVREVKLGMTFAEVEQALGLPATRVDLGEKVLYKYKDMTVEFHDGKVTDVR